ncbi:alfa-L-rhamnosidase [Nocardioides oleivorans]|uniref:alpha-L-rhamnosidase n=1 Tax=Nocardioides oleivorans TaxID=273676 RepID=A0A4Q2RZB9_9ACTN|nr:family 78 glycoside hydrolase catalytic domain [Nocardioides oleivorans]RYB94206.1 alfa-L-rhamnosidase [Nocardioides oleivorans]
MSRAPHLARLLVGSLALTIGLGALSPTAATAEEATTATAAAAATPLTVTGLETNARVDPIGIPGDAPSLSWHSTSTGRGAVQSAYQVRVAASEADLGGATLWDSGKVVSDRQVDVAYGGPDLESGTRYAWQVRVWNGDDEASGWSEPASFETGLLTAGDWQGDWIGRSASGEVDRWDNYTTDIDFDIADMAVGVFIRAANTSNALMWQLSVADGTPRFRPHKRVNGGYALLDNKVIPGITAAQLLNGTHRLSVTVDASTVTTLLDGTQIDQRTDTSFSKGFVGFRQDFVDAGNVNEAADIKKVTVTRKNGDVLLDTDFSDGNPFDGGTLTAGGLRVADRKDVLYRSPDSNKPLLRTSFTTEPGKTVESARVYASAQGVYEMRLNGEQVGDQFLAPGWTEYRKRIQHQTYDVTDQVRSGVNAFGAELGDGWWKGKIASFGFNNYGSNLGLIAQLRIDYTDGSTQVVKTDSTWKSHFGPYVQADNVEGETYDANAEQTGWDEPGFDDAAWGQVTTATNTTARLVPQPDEPVRVTDEIAAKKHTTPAPGVEIYDLGQNMVGVARMKLQGSAGTTVRIRYGEELNRDGSLYTANMRSAKVTDFYTFSSTGTATYTPKFTQHGFRYLEITGTTAAPALADVTGVVWGSDLRATGDLETSDPMLNRLVSNISWGQRGNFLSIPTDTPARDERLGWTGDINVFAPTASYLRDTRSFLGKWMTDLRDAAYTDGNVPGIAPVVPNAGDFGSGLGWSDAAITVPYATWKAWGDGRIVRENYAAMEKFLGFVRASAGPDLIDSGRGHWEDWLNLDDPTGVGVLGTMYYAEDARMLSEMAAAVGEDADAADYAALSTAVRQAFVAQFVQPDGTVQGNSQAGYAMALGMDMVADPALRAKVADKFVAKLAASNNHLTTGFLGTPWLLPALSSIGRDDLAYTMLLHKDYPSWGYEIEKGATTMWERWNSIMPDGSFGPVEMNSFNHYAYGAVGDWMYQNIGGITAVEAGYKVSRIAPVVGGGLTHGAGDFASAFGPISTDWALTDDGMTLAAQVPVGTTAEVVLPADNAYAVLEGGALLADVDGVQSVVDDGDTVTVTVGSGSYDFDVVAGNSRLGSILGQLDALKAHVGVLADDGDLTAGDRGAMDEGIDAVRGHVSDALLAAVDSDGSASTTALRAARAELRDLRAWLASSAVAGPVKSSLDGSLGAIENSLVLALTTALGVTTTLPPVAGAVLPGGTVTGTVDVTNDGSVPLTGLTGTVSVDGLGDAAVSGGPVGAGATVQLPVTVAVPEDARPGGHDATLSLTYTAGGDTFTVEQSTADWATVTSGLTIGDLAARVDGADPTEHATVSVPVTNTGSADVRAHALVTLPQGWKSVPSSDTLVPAGGTVTLEVPVVVPLDLVGGTVQAGVSVVRRGDVLASRTGSITVDLPRPPEADVLDHVDFGNSASENAHGIQASPSSGTSSEAGLSRRYSNSAVVGSWFSATVDVPAGEPFVLRGVETFDKAVTKDYDVYVDGVLVHTQLVPRTEGGQGIKVYDAVIDHPSLVGNDGNVRVRFEFPADGSSQGDPSIADLWVLEMPDDTQAPDVSATVAGGTQGSNGWFRSDVSVRVDTVDNRDDVPVAQTGLDPGSAAGWQDYVGPVAVTGEGEHVLSYRASDAAGNASTTRTLTVGIDATAPSTVLSVTTAKDAAGADRATLAFAATDAVSGVATTRYRVDGGAWQVAGSEPVAVEGVGDHTVQYSSTDVAGNAEVVRQAVLTLAAAPPTEPGTPGTVTSVLAPQVSGTARIGQELVATTGSWSTGGLQHAYQWLRDGSPIAGATSTSYAVGVADRGRRLSVQVTASKAGVTPASATSVATAPVRKATATVTAKVARTKVRADTRVSVTAKVKAPGVKASGKVRFVVDGKVVATVRLARNGTASASVLVRKGTHKVVVRYLGSASVSRATSPRRVVSGS